MAAYKTVSLVLQRTQSVIIKNLTVSRPGIEVPGIVKYK
jgi:hypothetical protein